MFSNIIIGQYYPSKSVIHGLDSRLKLIVTVIYIALLFYVKNPIGYAAVAAALCLVVRMSKVPFRFLVKGLRAIVFIILFTVFLNIFFMPGDTVLYQFMSVRVTLEGLVYAGKMAARLILLVCGSSVLTLTTSPLELTDAMEFLLRPFKKIGVPSHAIAMMLTIAFRYIPILFEEMDKIMKAQMARGADFDTGGIIKRAKSLIPLLVPLFLSAFRHADELAVAMEARCYRGDINRTRMKHMQLLREDYLAMACIAIFILIVIGINLFTRG